MKIPFFSKFKVAIGVCAHRNITLATFKSLWMLKDCPNPDISILPLDGDALISRSRSLVATHFLEKTDSDYLMFWDDDVVLSTYDATLLMQEINQKNLDILGAAYITKSKNNPGFAVRPLDDSTRLVFGRNGTIYEMRSISTGCMIISRRVLKAMVDSGQTPKCSHGGQGNLSYYPFFQHIKMQINGQWEDVSEDWYFCEEARKLGFKVWMDSKIKVGHIGAYEFNWDDLMNKGTRKEFDGINVNINRGEILKEESDSVPAQTETRPPLRAVMP